MDGAAVGPHPRAGRTSSRHGNTSSSSASPPAFSGPVRRWEKKWVHVSSSPSPLGRHLGTTTKKKTKSSQPGGGDNTTGPGILLCKWTPLLHHTSADADESSPCAPIQSPPRRKFRYTPTVVFEEQQKKAASEARSRSVLANPVLDDDDFFEMLNMNHILMGGPPQASEFVHSLVFGNESF
ncbi:hypothetical protein Dimus_012455 [Dionaea muscipula]